MLSWRNLRRDFILFVFLPSFSQKCLEFSLHTLSRDHSRESYSNFKWVSSSSWMMLSLQVFFSSLSFRTISWKWMSHFFNPLEPIHSVLFVWICAKKHSLEFKHLHELKGMNWEGGGGNTADLFLSICHVALEDDEKPEHCTCNHSIPFMQLEQGFIQRLVLMQPRE